MKFLKTLQVIAFLGLSAATMLADRGMGDLRTTPPAGVTTDEIIHKFASKEKQFKEARDRYTYRQTVVVDTLQDGAVDGEFKQVSDIVFDDKGKRVENVVFAPASTLNRVSMSQSDFDDIEKRLPFVLTTDDLNEYQINYVGQQKIDEIDTFVFDVAPKKIEKDKRYFQGRIWVDNQDYQIVVTEGRNVPDVRKKNKEDLSPKFTTYREQIDGQYWFPTYTIADDTLRFTSGDVQIREIVKYTNYKRFRATSTIHYEGEVAEPTPTPKKK